MAKTVKADVLFVSDEDLTRPGTKKSVFAVTHYDLKEIEPYSKAEIVIFTRGGESRVLKNRF